MNTKPLEAFQGEIYPAARVGILWNHREGDHAAKDVRVWHLPKGYFEHATIDAFQCTAGCINSGWLNPELSDYIPLATVTPEGVFGAISSMGFADVREYHRAIYEFARIDRCQWARLMLMGLGQCQEDAALALPDPLPCPD